MFARRSHRSSGRARSPIGARLAARPSALHQATSQVLRLARKATYRAIVRGDKAAAIRYSGIAWRCVPNHPFAVRLHVRALLAEPATPAECTLALAVLEPLLPSNPSLHSTWSDIVLAMVGAGMPAETVASHIVSFIETASSAAIERAGRLVEREVTFGRIDLAVAILDTLPDRQESRELSVLSHRIAALLGDLGRAERIAARAEIEPWMTPEEACHLAADRAMLGQHPEQAIKRLLALRPQRDRRYSLQLVTALRAIGRHDRVLEYLDGTRHGLEDIAIEFRYDALLALGELGAARELAVSIGPDRLGDARMLRIRLDDAQRAGSDEIHRLVLDVREFETSHVLAGHDVTMELAAYFELGLLDDMERLEATLPPAELNASSRLHLARMHYCRRAFDRADRVLTTLVGPNDRWDAEKLRARILLETGRAAEAIERRRAHTGPGDGDIDEVLYHALLKEHRFRDAFMLFSSRREQRRLFTAFGSRAEVGVELRHTGRRFVISQAGPGDEITSASLYGPLRDLSDELFVTCDPRLETLLTRSFPDITFVPVERLRPRSAFFLAAGRARRAENALFDLLTEEAMGVASSCDRVVMSKSMQHLAIESPRSRPYCRYLVPDPRLVAEVGSRWDGGNGPIGVVWRSELRSPMRQIHYVEVSDLAPLLERDATFVSLQYDATEPERDELKRLTSGRVVFVDDINLRDDFELAAALSANLSAVVGIGTTALELAAAMGVPCVMLQPTHFGTWRSMDADGQDFWHRSLRVAACEHPWNRRALVDAGRTALGEILGPPAARH